MASELTSQCSRYAPENFEGTWEPSDVDIQELEKRFALIEDMQAEKCCALGATVSDVHAYYRQYVGIIVNGRKLIYINAIRRGAEHDFDWRAKPLIACDGGFAFWGALYDPEDSRFLDLAFNGIG